MRRGVQISLQRYIGGEFTLGGRYVCVFGGGGGGVEHQRGDGSDFIAFF